ncbi:glycosyltransferase [Streptococcus varani]|uniref:Glycosyltransferase n=1 Tax=Streptococcus varani TaxID=1608583 RepID=A0A0E4H3Z4_9STRE|nr:glycosyltransferase family 4 protein [Streptococcus varani]CQR24849.1 glycosyltransferase [Streptococcus varani]
MRIALFTDTYFPQVSGVATSIKTLKTELEKLGHIVFIFTTTDRDVDRYEDWDIIRLPSVPFFAFKDRRVAYAGFSDALKIARRYQLDIIHTHTEFSMGILGVEIANALNIPVVHTYHTHYEDYVRYIAKGLLIRPKMIKYFVRGFFKDVDGVICPSEIVENLLQSYEVQQDLRVIPTGIDLAKFDRPEIQKEDRLELREKLGIEPHETMLLSLSRISYEKNIQAVIQAMPTVLAENPHVKLVIAGGGPYVSDLKKLIADLKIQDAVIMTGMIAPSETALYYKTADFFISASTSETQGLTYLESLASGTPIIAHGNLYLDNVIDKKMFGTLYYHDKELADAILDAVLATPEMDPLALKEKLYEISAENFGKKAYEYYLDLKIAKDFNNEYLYEESLPIYLAQKASQVPFVIARTASNLPKRILVTTTQQTRKIVKLSVSKIKSIRNNLD